MMGTSPPALPADSKFTHGRTAIAGAMILAVALVHLLGVGNLLHGRPYRLYYSYVSDIIVPVAMYFVLCLSEARHALFRPWQVKAALVFGVASCAEALQWFGVPILGRTFDPADFVMYAVGVSAAAFLDRIAVPAALRRWPARRHGAG